MITNYNLFNESLKDKLKGKSDEEIDNNLSKISTEVSFDQMLDLDIDYSFQKIYDQIIKRYPILKELNDKYGGKDTSDDFMWGTNVYKEDGSWDIDTTNLHITDLDLTDEQVKEYKDFLKHLPYPNLYGGLMIN